MSRRLLSRWFSLALLLACSSVLVTTPGSAARKHPHRPLLVGYFPQWGIYNQPQYFVKNLDTSGGAAMLDQVNYAQGSPKGGHCSLADPNADLNYTFTAINSVNGASDDPASLFRGNLHQLEELKHKYPRLKILVSLEGSADFFAEDAQPQNRQTFVASCVDLFLKGRFAPGVNKPGLIDGIDLDWEYPKASDAANFLALLTEFRRQMDHYHRGLRLTIAAGPSPHMYPGVDMHKVSRAVDEFGIMNYDYAGPWSTTTGIIAPLYDDPQHPLDGGSVDGTISEYLAAGVEPAKMLMGLPFYGYGWNNVTATHNGLLQTGKPVHGDQPYSYVAGLVAASTVYRDQRTQAPWLYDGQSFWTYEDPTSIAYKIDYTRHRQLGGIMIWELSGDSLDGSLLKTAYSHLGHTDQSAPAPASEPSAGLAAPAVNAATSAMQ